MHICLFEKIIYSCDNLIDQLQPVFVTLCVKCKPLINQALSVLELFFDLLVDLFFLLFLFFHALICDVTGEDLIGIRCSYKLDCRS